MNIAVIANGQIYDYDKILEKIKDFQMVIAADGGASHCLMLGIVPDLIVGDFDSISSQAAFTFTDVPKILYPKEKDETDLELALTKAFFLNSDKVTLFGATGQRMDHTLVNLHLLRRYPGKLIIETENESIFSLNSNIASKPYKIETIPGQTISFLPFQTAVKGVISEGLKWELKDEDLDEEFLSVSNICLTANTTISIKNGELLCFLIDT